MLPARMICGVDEAGRGPLAGPVFAACVILSSDHPIDGLADSKTLTADRRDQLAMLIRSQARAWSVASASVAEIESLNILWATMLAMKRAVDMLSVMPSEALIDGNRCPDLVCPATAIVNGDSLVPQISAASILAKVARDAHMLQLHQRYPDYGFDRHKGYPTKYHIQALHDHGVSPVHRRNFAPVRAIVESTQTSRRR
jgi:ribonuclease HII